MAKLLWFLALGLLVLTVSIAPLTHAAAAADDTDIDDEAPAVPKGGAAGTDTGTLAKEAQAIKVDGLTPQEYKNLKASSDKHTFQAEVSRMMKLIINSLYTNKEIFLRELISNASDALDKIRFLSLTNPGLLGTVTDLQIKIHVDKENHVLHITDTGVGMTKEELIKNLGTIAKSGTSEFLAKASESASADHSNLIGQFGVGFYSAFLVADTVVVTSKHNDDKQWIWESDANSFTVVEDTRVDEQARALYRGCLFVNTGAPQLGRGTRVSLYLKEEAHDFLEQNTIKDLIVKYSEFIAFDIYLYTSKTVQVEEEEAEAATEEADAATDAEDVEVEDEEEGAKAADAEPAKKKMVDQTVWDWEIINANKPIWTRAEKDVTADEYNKFYKAFTKSTEDPLGQIHFTAEGEVTFRSILYIPEKAPANFFNEYGKHGNNIKMYVRRVFITDSFDEMLPKYLAFIKGVVDSDDLPLNVSRESLQQHKLLKVIKKKLIRKALEMIKKLDEEQYKKFWKEYGTSIKLGVIEDYANRTRLAKLLRFLSSNSGSEMTSLEDYVARMKKDQENIYFIAGSSEAEVKASPFAERLLKKGFEVLYLTEAVDEYTVQNLPEFDGKKFQNAAKEGLKLSDDDQAAQDAFAKSFEPLTKWFSDNLASEIDKAVVSNRLTETPCALIASQYGWSGNMERIMKAQAYAKQDDASSSYYATQKKTLEINPRHPLIKKLNDLVQDEDASDEAIKNRLELAKVLVDTARLRSGFALGDSAAFAARIERMLRLSVNVDVNEAAEAEAVSEPVADASTDDQEDTDDVDADTDTDAAAAPQVHVNDEL